eukprot:jgi/Undpi1/1506/HiC_scaffold_11.g04896.m1
MLCPAEKDEVILQMHAKLRHLTDRLEEVIAFSERTLSCLERTHEDALRERLASEQRLRREMILSEQRLRQELHGWRHQHPEAKGGFVVSLPEEDGNDSGRHVALQHLHGGRLSSAQKRFL